MSQWIGIQATLWVPLSKALLTMRHSTYFLSPKSSLSLGPYSSFLRQSIVRARVPSPPRVKPQVNPIEDLTTGLMEYYKRDTPYLPENWGHHNIAGSFAKKHNNTQCPKRLSLCLSTCEISTATIPASFLVQFLCFGCLASDFRHWPVYSALWSCHCPFLTIYFRGDIEGLPIGWRQRGLDSWFGLWNAGFLIYFMPEYSFTCRTKLEVFSTLVPLRDTMIKQLSCIFEF